MTQSKGKPGAYDDTNPARHEDAETCIFAAFFRFGEWFNKIILRGNMRMKKAKFRLISIILVLILIFQVSSISGFGENTDNHEHDHAESENYELTEDDGLLELVDSGILYSINFKNRLQG